MTDQKPNAASEVFAGLSAAGSAAGLAAAEIERMRTAAARLGAALRAIRERGS